MFKAFNAFITTLFTACNSLALAAGHLAGWAEQSAGAFADEAALTREANRIQLNKDLKLASK